MSLELTLKERIDLAKVYDEARRRGILPPLDVVIDVILKILNERNSCKSLR